MINTIYEKIREQIHTHACISLIEMPVSEQVDRLISKSGTVLRWYAHMRNVEAGLSLVPVLDSVWKRGAFILICNGSDGARKKLKIQS